MLSAQFRLTEDWQIRRTLRQGTTQHSRSFVLNRRPNRSEQVRFAFIASKKVGKAVDRNRAVRLLREAVRVYLNAFPASHDYVFVARKGVVQLKMQSVAQELEALLYSSNYKIQAYNAPKLGRIKNEFGNQKQRGMSKIKRH